MLTVLAFLAASLAWAPLPAEKETIFPSDTQDPRQARGAELLEAVCPGAVTVGNEIGCDVDCPEHTDFAGDHLGWSLEAVTFGHFQSSRSNDAVLSMGGCESHASNFGGTILLARKSDKWSMLWYKSAIVTRRCHKVSRRDGREILVCIGTDGGQGNNATELYGEDLLNPRPTLMAGGPNDGGFFGAFDDTVTCGWQQGDDKPGSDPVIRSHIDEVAFSRREGAPTVTVTARFGRKVLTRAEVDACMGGNGDVLPPTKIYRMDFQYDGSGFKPLPTSVESVQIIEAR